MTLRTGSKAYYLEGRPKGLVAGTRVRGRDDHLTLGSDEAGFSQVHRKINGREDWRLTPESLQAEVDSFLANKTSAFDANSIAPDSWAVSLGRATVGISLLSGLLSLSIGLLARLVSTTTMVKTEDGLSAEVRVDPVKVEHLLKTARVPASMFSPLLRRAGPSIIPRLLRRAAKVFLIKSPGPRDFEQGALLLVSKDRTGLVWSSSDGDLRFVPIGAIFEAFARIERNQPFGKLNEVFEGEYLSIEARSWTPSQSS